MRKWKNSASAGIRRIRNGITHSDLDLRLSLTLIRTYYCSGYPKPGWIAVVVIAGAFALSHLVKAGITPWQIVAIFLTGCLYGWLRLDSGSTAPPLFAHVVYNSVLFGIAFLR